MDITKTVPIWSANGLLLGHSFASSLDDHYNIILRNVNPNFRNAYIAKDLQVNNNIGQVFLHGQSGATCVNFSPPYLFTSFVRPDIILLELGSNDIANRVPPVTVASNLYNIAEDLHRRHGSVIGLLSILPRTERIGKLTADDFYARMHVANDTLKMYCKEENDWWAYFYKHKRFWEVEK